MKKFITYLFIVEGADSDSHGHMGVKEMNLGNDLCRGFERKIISEIDSKSQKIVYSAPDGSLLYSSEDILKYLTAKGKSISAVK